MNDPVVGLSIEVRYSGEAPIRRWTVYLIRDGDNGKPVAYSEHLPMINGGAIAKEWADFLGLKGFDVSYGE